jgi:hypothetical protein
VVGQFVIALARTTGLLPAKQPDTTETQGRVPGVHPAEQYP